MNKTLPLIMKLIAISQVIFVVGYFLYFIYIGLQWGFGDRIILLIIADSVFLLLLLSTIGILGRKQWGWWITIIIYSKLLIARVVTVIASVVNVLIGLIAEPLQMNLLVVDLLIITLYIVIISILSQSVIRNKYDIGMVGSKLFFFVGITSIILYVIYFIFMLLSITWLL